MSLVYSLLVLSVLKHKSIIIVYICIMTYFLKEKFLIVSLLYFISLSLVGYDFFEYHTVDRIYDHKIILRNGLNQYDYFEENDFEIGDKVKVIHKEHYGTYDNTKSVGKVLDVVFVKSNTLRKPKIQLQEEGITETLSLQLRGFIQIGTHFYRWFLYNDYLVFFQIGIAIFYQLVYGVSFSTIRITLSILIKKREWIIIILIILFPKAIYYPGFLIVYGPFILRHLSTKWYHVDHRIIQMFLLTHFFGKVNLLELTFYKIIRNIMGAMVWTDILFNLRWSLPKFNSPIFWMVGAPSLLWLFLFRNIKSRWQWPLFLSVMVVQMYFPLPRVSMIQVYQGDATLITLPFNMYTILVDTGKPSAYMNLKRELYKQGIRKIDTLVITHPDLDHDGNKEAIISDFNVDFVMESKEDKHFLFDVLLNDMVYEDENENSLILYFNIFKHTFLLMGDAGVVQENEIVNRYPFLDVSVLKLGHHGSKTSSSLKFLERVRPKLALISSDPRIYNHPHPEVMKRLYQLKIIPIETHKEDTVILFLLPFCKVIVSNRLGFGIMR